ncbi:hypothetical protein, partial [Flavobacterium sp. HTF]|uniref:hypothetical protein n=1 Tax=Flavobacterium sp. HTF TaxID=2170732 RepID=UPI000D5C43C0
ERPAREHYLLKRVNIHERDARASMGLSKRQNLFATEIFELYRCKIRFGNGTMLGYGIIPSSSNQSFRGKIKRILEE